MGRVVEGNVGGGRKEMEYEIQFFRAEEGMRSTAQSGVLADVYMRQLDCAVEVAETSQIHIDGAVHVAGTT